MTLRMRFQQLGYMRSVAGMILVTSIVLISVTSVNASPKFSIETIFIAVKSSTNPAFESCVKGRIRLLGDTEVVKTGGNMVFVVHYFDIPAVAPEGNVKGFLASFTSLRKLQAKLSEVNAPTLAGETIGYHPDAKIATLGVMGYNVSSDSDSVCQGLTASFDQVLDQYRK